MSNMVHNLTQTPLHISSFAVFLLLLRLIVLMLSTFYAWSVEHIQRVFEAKTSAECLRAVDDTFSQKIELTLNGNSLPRIHLQRAILAMVESSGFQLTVHWQNAVEVPQDELNRVSSVSPARDVILTAVLFRRTGCLEDTILSGISEKKCQERQSSRDSNGTSP